MEEKAALWRFSLNISNGLADLETTGTLPSDEKADSEMSKF